MKRIAQLSIMGLVLTMGLIQAKNLDKVRIGYVAEPAHGLFFLAQEKGFFKEDSAP
jgi:NitT/TauT family transport system substrate-binding protein